MTEGIDPNLSGRLNRNKTKTNRKVRKEGGK